MTINGGIQPPDVGCGLVKPTVAPHGGRRGALPAAGAVKRVLQSSRAAKPADADEAVLSNDDIPDQQLTAGEGRMSMMCCCETWVRTLQHKPTRRQILQVQDPALAERLRRVLREDPQAVAGDASIQLYLDGAVRRASRVPCAVTLFESCVALRVSACRHSVSVESRCSGLYLGEHAQTCAVSGFKAASGAISCTGADCSGGMNCWDWFNDGDLHTPRELALTFERSCSWVMCRHQAAFGAAARGPVRGRRRRVRGGAARPADRSGDVQDVR